jgi:PAS domain-containing protein
MNEGSPKNLALILSRQLASNLASAMFLVDASGDLVFYNEAAADLIGKTFEEVGQMSAWDWGGLLHLQDLEGNEIRRGYSPSGVAFFQRRPSHQVLSAQGFDGRRRRIEATAYPLFSKQDEFSGVVTIFWETDDGTGVAQ